MRLCARIFRALCFAQTAFCVRLSLRYWSKSAELVLVILETFVSESFSYCSEVFETLWKLMAYYLVFQDLSVLVKRSLFWKLVAFETPKSSIYEIYQLMKISRNEICQQMKISRIAVYRKWWNGISTGQGIPMALSKCFGSQNFTDRKVMICAFWFCPRHKFFVTDSNLVCFSANF